MAPLRDGLPLSALLRPGRLGCAEPTDYDYVVLKSAVHFRSNFTELAGAIVEVTGPGIHSSRMTDFVYKKVARPLWPLDANDGAKLWVDGELLVDQFESAVEDDDATGYVTFSGAPSAALVADRLYDIKLEYRESTGPAHVRLLWSSASQPKIVVPTYRLFHSTTPIVNSPFDVTPQGKKPSAPLNPALAINSESALDLTWEPQ